MFASMIIYIIDFKSINNKEWETVINEIMKDRKRNVLSNLEKIKMIWRYTKYISIYIYIMFIIYLIFIIKKIIFLIMNFLIVLLEF